MVPLIALLLGTGIIFLSLHALSRTRIDIENGIVRYRKTNPILKSVSWAASFSEYEGVLEHQMVVPGGKNRPSHTVYLCDLIHRTDKKKNIELYSSRTSSDHRARAERFSRLLNLPMLVEGENKYEKRAAGDLDLSVRERISKGSVEMIQPASLRPPKGRLSRVALNGEEWISISSIGYLPLGLPFAGFGAALSVFAGIMSGNWIALVFGTIFFLIGLIIILASFCGREYIGADREGVSHYWTFLRRRFGQVSMQARAIEEIRVGRRNQGQGLQVISDQMRIGIFSPLSKEDREWLRSYLLTKLS
ncbi:MAG TPA: hypothetical protein VI895_04065 [Bdellovibrionota bacterium]|nr:hypothetical protein [Bdellovibrionota bacterium]